MRRVAGPPSSPSASTAANRCIMASFRRGRIGGWKANALEHRTRFEVGMVEAIQETLSCLFP